MYIISIDEQQAQNERIQNNDYIIIYNYMAYSNTNNTINRSHSRKHYNNNNHEQSMDDFMKNIKKFNLRSQRYISPKPLLYMYAKNNTTNTIDKDRGERDARDGRPDKSRSKTLSNHKSRSNQSRSRRSKKDNKEKDKQGKHKLKHKQSQKKLKKKLQKIFQQPDRWLNSQSNPAIFIQSYGQMLKRAQNLVSHNSTQSSTIPSFLCNKFLKILNNILQKIVHQLDSQLSQLERKTCRQIQARYQKKLQKLQKINHKMGGIINDMLEKAKNNSKLIYQIRLRSQIDVDYIFGKTVLGTQKCGGQGYGNDRQETERSEREGHSGQFLIRIPQKNARNANQIADQLRYPNLNLNLNLNMNRKKQRNGQPLEQKQSGRIRPAYDWERQAYDDKVCQKQKQKQKQRQRQRQKQVDQQQHGKEQQQKMGEIPLQFMIEDRKMIKKIKKFEHLQQQYEQYQPKGQEQQSNQQYQYQQQQQQQQQQSQQGGKQNQNEQPSSRQREEFLRKFLKRKST